jgi:hypothetical protein
MPCLAIRNSLHVGRFVCVAGPRDSSIPSVPTPTPLGSQGAFWMRTASKSMPPLLSPDQATFCQRFAPLGISRGLFASSRVTMYCFCAGYKKGCALRDLGEEGYSHESSSGIMDMAKRRLDYRPYKRRHGRKPKLGVTAKGPK